MWLVSHPELSQTDPLYWFLLMLFGVAPDTPCGLMCLGADRHRSHVHPAAVRGNHNRYNGLSLLQKHSKERQPKPSSVNVLWNSLQLSKNMPATEPNLQLPGRAPG